MLKTLIAKLAKPLFRPKYNPGYQTRVYPRLGEMIIVHDSLDFGPIATADELKPINDFWLSDEMPDTGLLTHDDCEDVFTFDSLPGINPASGLPCCGQQNLSPLSIGNPASPPIPPSTACPRHPSQSP